MVVLEGIRNILTSNTYHPPSNPKEIFSSSKFYHSTNLNQSQSNLTIQYKFNWINAFVKTKLIWLILSQKLQKPVLDKQHPWPCIFLFLWLNRIQTEQAPTNWKSILKIKIPKGFSLSTIKVYNLFSESNQQNEPKFPIISINLSSQ